MIVASFDLKTINSALVEFETIDDGVNRRILDYTISQLNAKGELLEIQTHTGNWLKSQIPDNENFKIIHFREPARMPGTQNTTQPVLRGDTTLWLDGYITDKAVVEGELSSLENAFISNTLPQGVYSFFMLKDSKLYCGCDTKFARVAYDATKFCFTTFTRYRTKNMIGGVKHLVDLENMALIKTS